MSRSPDSQGSVAMEEDEDDFYGNNGDVEQPPQHRRDEDDDEMDQSEEESDSDIEIVTERKEGEEPEESQTTRTVTRQDGTTTVTTSQDLNSVAKVDADGTLRPSANTQPLTLKSGLAYPEVRTSSFDVNGNPVYPPIGKPITEIDIDADLAEHEKPWRRPGADQADYFNYGFDEFTWATYCLRQRTMGDTLAEQKADNAKFEMMFGGAGGMMPGMMPGMGAAAPQQQQVNAPSMPAMPAMPSMPGMPGIPGIPGMQMPNQQEFQRLMLQAMEEQGISDPSQLDFKSFMDRLQGGMGQAAAMPGGGQQQQYGGNWQGGGAGAGVGGNYRGRRGRW